MQRSLKRPLDPDFRVGISGWTYAGWRRVFYPEGLQHARELEYASRHFGSIEINGTFYSLQYPSSYRKWREDTPDGFVFGIKGSRFITHLKQLRDVEIPLANFFASGVLALGPKLGPLLWQFAQRTRFDEEKFRAFLQILPRTTGEALALAHWHDERVVGREHLEIESDVPLRHTFEVRHDSFDDPRFYELLRQHNVALTMSDSPGTWPYFEELTADFVYIRLHGSRKLYASRYTDAELDSWAARILSWQRDAYVYFDNDSKVQAPFDAQRLQERLNPSSVRKAS